MGHVRLGTIPKSKAWSQVVSVLTKSAQASEDMAETSFRSSPPQRGLRVQDQSTPLPVRHPYQLAVGDIAAQTLVAAEKALNRASDDLGFRYTFFLLTRVAAASRSPTWYDALRQYGVQLDPTSTAFDLTTGFQDAIDQYVA